MNDASGQPVGPSSRDNRPKKIISEEVGPELHHGRSLKSGVGNYVVIHECRRILSGLIVILLQHLPSGLMKSVTELTEVAASAVRF